METILFLWDKAGTQFLLGTWVTIYTSFFAVILGMVVGAIVCLMRMSRIAPLRWIAYVYIEVIRGTPLLLQLWLFYLLPTTLGFAFSQYGSAMFALVVNSGAYAAELIRSGIQSIDHGQAEASRSLGLSHGQTMRHIILPQAARNILPAMGNEFIQIIKETSLLSVFMIGDLMTVRAEIGTAYYMPLQALIIVGAIYFVLTFVLSRAMMLVERRMAASD